MAAAAAVYDHLFHGSRDHNHRKHFRPTTSRCPFPTSLRCLNARLSTSSPSSTTTVENKMPMSESHFLKLFNSSCRTGEHNHALALLESMVSAGYSPGPVRCTELVEGFAASPSNLLKAEQLMHALHLHGSPDADTYTSLIAALCRADRITATLSLLRSMRCPPNSATYDTLIGYFADRRLFPQALALLRRMLASPQAPPTILSYTSLVDACIAEGGLRRATNLLDEMSTHGVAPGIDLWKTILAHMCRSNQVDHALHLLKHVSYDISTYNVVLDALLKAGRWVDGESVLEEMFSDGKVLPNVSTYNLLIHSLCRAGRVDDAVQVFWLMPCRGCGPNEDSYHPIISAYCNDGRVDHAVALLQRMVAERGRVMDIRTVNPLVESLCKLQLAVEAASMLRVLQDYCCFQEVSTYNIVVGGLWAQGEKGAAVALLGEMLGKGLKPDAVTYEVLIHCLCKDGLVDRARGLAGDMAAAGLSANRTTMNVLLRGLCDVRMMEEAVEVFLGWIMWFHMDDVSDAERMLNKPNEKTYEILSEGIAQVGCTEEAVELAVKLRSLRAISDATLRRVKRKVNLLANNYNN